MEKPRLSVLVVDDDELVARATGRCLRVSYRVRTSTQVEDAIRQCEEELPDVILADMDSGPFLIAIRKQFPSVRRIVYSGGRPEFLADVVESGIAHAAVCKPASMDQLRGAIEGFAVEASLAPLLM
jgi:CheY-like chemotaxis protein